MLTRRTRTTAAAAATFVAVLTAGAGPAAAQEPEQGIVNVGGCAFFDEDHATTVLAGPTEGFVNGWGSGTRGLVTSYLSSQETTVTVVYNGQPATTLDLSDAYSTPVLNEDGFWTTELRLPLGDLAVGDTVVISVDITLKTPVPDFVRGDEGYNFPPRGNLVPRGTQAAGTCTITVVEG